MSSDTQQSSPPDTGEERRDFLTKLTSLLMVSGLAGGYGAFGAVALRYLFPPRPPRQEWLYVSRVDEIPPGGSRPFTTPSGATVTIVRGTESDFIALSSTCPHLGCRVHWEAHNNRFFCPCHNGVFSPSGEATAGPPAEAGQSLPKYPLKTVGGMLFMEVELAERAV